MSIATIVNQIKKQDEQAFEQIYNEYHKLVFFVIYEIVKNKEIALDLVQDTFLTVYNKIDQYDGGNFKYWIITIAKNLALNYYNRVIKKEDHVIHNDEMVESYVEETSSGLGKYDEILDKHFTKEEKEIIVYHVVFGYSYKEIAEILNEDPKKIGKKCRRLLNILKNIVRED